MTSMAEKDNGSRVWAIVLTHGGAEEITAACIDSLLAQDYPALTILLVDNASFDGSGERLRDRYPQIGYINTGGNYGYTGGNNRGMKYALENGADYLLILNNDTVVEKDCVSWLMRSVPEAQRLSGGRLGALAPKILYYDDPARIWYGGGDYSYFRALGAHRRENELDSDCQPPGIEPITFATGCCFLYPSDAARDIGGFREDFFIYCEDVELSLRLNRSGYQLFYQPAARIRHREGRTPRLASPFATVHRDRNRRRLVEANYSLPWRVLFRLWFYPTRLVRLTQHLLRGDRQGARAVISGSIGRW